MTLSLPAQPNLSHLKKQAKTLLMHFRLQQNGGDDSNPSYLQALKTVHQYHPKPALFSGLRDAQLVIARQYGYIDWAELTQAVQLALLAAKTLGEQVDIFIESACVKYNGGGDNAMHYQQAKQLLAQNPDIGSYNFYAAIVANNLIVVQKYLKKTPSLATQEGGPLGWLPIHYLAYSRVDEVDNKQYSIDILKLLLSNGADANSQRILHETLPFTTLTGVIGEGEGGFRHQPPHQFSQEMAIMLLEAGANPNDSQGLYNTLFGDNHMGWLRLLVDHGLSHSHKLNWSEELNAQSTFDFLLSYAVRRGLMDRVVFLLNQGADPNAVNVYNQRTAYANALVTGRKDIADYLCQQGARVDPLNAEDQLRAAISRGDISSIKKMLNKHPDFIHESDFLHHAAQDSQLAIVKNLLDFGFDINGLSQEGRSILHTYAWEKNVDAIKALIELGANSQVEDKNYQATPLGFAVYNNAKKVIHYLVDQSNNIVEVVAYARGSRAKKLLAEDPDRLHQRSQLGMTLLHVIGVNLQGNADDDDCEHMLDLLLESGLGIHALSDDGKTALAFAKENVNQQMVDILESRGA